MSSLTIYYPGALEPFSVGGHRQVTLKSNVGVSVLTITSPEVEHSGLADRWVAIERPGLESLLRRAGGGLHKFRLRATLNAPAGRDLEDDLAILAHGHTRMDDIAVGYGRLEAGRFVITDLMVRSLLRQQGSNNVIRAEVELEFSKRPPEPAQVLPVVVPATQPPAPAPPPSAPRRHVATAFDTIYGLAIDYYGDGRLWRRIADANGIRSPRHLRAGQIIIIP